MSNKFKALPVVGILVLIAVALIAIAILRNGGDSPTPPPNPTPTPTPSDQESRWETKWPNGNLQFVHYENPKEKLVRDSWYNQDGVLTEERTTIDGAQTCYLNAEALPSDVSIALGTQLRLFCSPSNLHVAVSASNKDSKNGDVLNWTVTKKAQAPSGFDDCGGYVTARNGQAEVAAVAQVGNTSTVAVYVTIRHKVKVHLSKDITQPEMFNALLAAHIVPERVTNPNGTNPSNVFTVSVVTHEDEAEVFAALKKVSNVESVERD